MNTSTASMAPTAPTARKPSEASAASAGETTVAKAPTYDVALKTIEPIRVAAVHGVVLDVMHIGDSFDSLFGILEGQVQRNGGRAGPSMAIYGGAGSSFMAEPLQRVGMDVELAIPFRGTAAPNERVRVYELPRVEEAAYVVHEGPYEAIGSAYHALLTWMREQGYSVAGPIRELFLNRGMGGGPGYVTEVQVPVAKHEP